jgi:uncharacterized protein (DUF4415 family)
VRHDIEVLEWPEMEYEDRSTRGRPLKAFKTATTKPAEPLPKKPALPSVKELVSLRIDQEVLEHFQESGPGWQDRINEALRRAVGK